MNIEQTCAACGHHVLDRESQEHKCRISHEAYPNGGQQRCGQVFCERAYKWPAISVCDRQRAA